MDSIVIVWDVTSWHVVDGCQRFGDSAFSVFKIQETIFADS
jgi:hypothetical protein